MTYQIETAAKCFITIFQQWCDFPKSYCNPSPTEDLSRYPLFAFNFSSLGTLYKMAAFVCVVTFYLPLRGPHLLAAGL